MKNDLMHIEEAGYKALTRYTKETGHCALSGRALWSRMVEKAWGDESFAADLILWFNGGGGTIRLRKIAAQVGYDYWGNLFYSNSIDAIDTAFIYRLS